MWAKMQAGLSEDHALHKKCITVNSGPCRTALVKVPELNRPKFKSQPHSFSSVTLNMLPLNDNFLVVRGIEQ